VGVCLQKRSGRKRPRGLPGMDYPWGNEKPVCQKGALNGSNFYDCDVKDTEPVGSYSPNGYGVFDMAGNVWNGSMTGTSQIIIRIRLAMTRPVQPLAIGRCCAGLLETHYVRPARCGPLRHHSERLRLRLRFSLRCSPRKVNHWSTEKMRCIMRLRLSGFSFFNNSLVQ